MPDESRAVRTAVPKCQDCSLGSMGLRGDSDGQDGATVWLCNSSWITSRYKADIHFLLFYEKEFVRPKFESFYIYVIRFLYELPIGKIHIRFRYRNHFQRRFV